ncbi:hypothetical protein [Paracoccus spongiarum]|uniref:Uncharacterized protein n=1 Tax=Paracoccus spongiarum TaxID=3064387 RepID=A0ABT9JDB6_9RHOB|nr:hypothetical protein [Paracoccus sp. 2205BS29-5]MDP5307810.1 hypothetical protein [Paracoccus sp. 2205BS29-5]
MSREEDILPLTEADRVSQTRFGPRSVPKGHRPGSQHGPMRASRVIADAPMSPDGRRPYPTPSTASKVIVWGGVALGVAGVTAAALMAARKLAADTPDRPHERPGPTVRQGAPRPARPADTVHVRPAAAPVAASRKTGNLARDLTDTASELSASLNGVAQSLVSAFDGFSRVARQSSGLVREFAQAADQIRTVMGRADAARGTATPRPQDRDEKRRHNL